MSDKWDVGQVGCRTSGMSDKWDVGQVGCRTSGMSDKWATQLSDKNPLLNVVVSSRFSVALICQDKSTV